MKIGLIDVDGHNFPFCNYGERRRQLTTQFCPNCGAKMDGGAVMDVREKLVEIMEDLGCNNIDGCVHRRKEIIADRLFAHGVTVQEWISVKDRLPDNKEHDWVLAQVVEDNGYMHIPRVMEYRQAKDDWFEETYGWLSEHNGIFTVTHWMPLPPPPKGE